MEVGSEKLNWRTLERMVNGWKVTAIISIILNLLILSFVGWGVSLVAEDAEVTNECWYNTCSDFEDAYYDTTNGMCYCYMFNDETRELDIAKETYMK